MLITMLAIAVMQVQTPAPRAPLHYRLDAKTTQDQDLTTMGRGKITGSLTTTAFFTVTTTDSAEGQVSLLKVDSMRLATTGAMALQLPQASANAAADSARGASVHVFTVHGGIRGTPRPSVQNPALAPILQATGVLYPPLRAGIKAGDSWADTTKINSDLPNGPHQDGTILILWNVSATESGALAVDGAVTSNVTSTGQGGQRLTAIGSSKQHYIMAGPGVVRDATVESTTDASTVHEAGAAPVPSKNISTLKLTRLP